MGNSDRIRIFLINFFVGFGGSFLGGLILIWLFPIDQAFNSEISSLLGFSIIVGLMLGFVSLLVNKNK